MTAVDFALPKLDALRQQPPQLPITRSDIALCRCAASCQIRRTVRRRRIDNTSTHAHRPHQRLPPECQCRNWMCGELGSLRTGRWSCECPALLIDVTNDQCPCIRQPFVIHRGQDSYVRFSDATVGSEPDPGQKLLARITRPIAFQKVRRSASQHGKSTEPGSGVDAHYSTLFVRPASERAPLTAVAIQCNGGRRRTRRELPVNIWGSNLNNQVEKVVSQLTPSGTTPREARRSGPRPRRDRPAASRAQCRTRRAACR